MSYEDRLLASNEHIVFRTRQHWIVLAYQAVINLVPALILGCGILLLTIAFPPAIFALVLLALPVGRFILFVLKWWNEQHLITNRRVIQTEGIITKHVIDSSIEKVNDVVLTQSVWGRLLNYGDVEILTASEVGINKMQRIGRPVAFKTVMMDQKGSLIVLERAEDTAMAAAARPPSSSDIPQLIAQLEDLRRQGIITQAEFDQKKKDLMARL
jgi:uncharacterized membrane protein YdbT with pleckstrin-like domain